MCRHHVPGTFFMRRIPQVVFLPDEELVQRLANYFYFFPMVVSSFVYCIHFQQFCPLSPLVTNDIHLQNSWIKLGVQFSFRPRAKAELRAHTGIKPITLTNVGPSPADLARCKCQPGTKRGHPFTFPAVCLSDFLIRLLLFPLTLVPLVQ